MVRIARAASALFFVVVAGLLIQRPVGAQTVILLIPALSVPRKTVKSSRIFGSPRGPTGMA